MSRDTRRSSSGDRLDVHASTTFIAADALRLLSIDGALNFRHTIISEFIYPDQNKGIKRLDRRIRQVMRSTQGVSGRHRLSTEASVALQDLGAIRQDLAGGREALTNLRFYVVVYGEPARARAETAASLKNLDRHCEQVIAEIRKISGSDADREESSALNILYPTTLVGENDLRIAQVERNVSTITNRAMDVAEGEVGLMGGMAGKSLPLVYAMRDSAQMASGMKAIKLEQISQIVTALSRDMARRAELALTMRY